MYGLYFGVSVEKIFNLKNTVIFVCFSVAWKIFLASALCLHPDEAYYWLWSTNLQLSYYDHAPMVAYFIKLTTLFSNSELAVRFSTIIATVILTFLLWKLVKSLFKSEVTASAAIIILHSMPILFSVSIITTPDTPSFLFLSVATFFVWKLIKSENQNYWYLIGLFFGLSMLSKYTACLFLMSLFFYMLLDKKIYWFKSYQLYLGIIISVICFLPVIYWNWQHDWASFSYQIGHGLSNKGIRFNYIFEYLGTQAGVFNVILFFPVLYIGIKYLFSKNTEKVFIAAFSVPVILFYVITALKRLPGGNWPIPAYFTFAIIAAIYFADGIRFKKKLLIISIILNIVLSVLVGLHAKFSIFPVELISEDAAIADTTNWFYSYKELTEKLLKENYSFVMTPSHQLSSTIAYYSKNKIKTAVLPHKTKKSQYDFWPLPEELKNSNGAFVFEYKDDNSYFDTKHIFNDVFDINVFAYLRHHLIIKQFVIKKVGTVKSDFKFKHL